jgi:Zn-dependent peptidase ImmA (M78 family)
MANYVKVNPDLLRWAVDRSGVPIASFREPVQKWISEERPPTYSQLENFARQAMVPFGYLFLDRPPDETLPIPDYRTRSDDGVRKPSPNLKETIFEMQARQEWMREYLIDEGHGALPFVGSANVGDAVEPLARQIRNTLQLNEAWAEGLANWEAALRYLRERIEETGILIFINGVVGNNNRRKLNPDEFQGFVFVDPIVPLIFVNGADFKVAQMFTVAHELAHVWVGQSALFDLVATSPSEVDVERYCNSVAAEFLIPAQKLNRAWPSAPKGDQAFISLARQFKVSPIVVARRAKDQRMITAEEFFAFYRRHMNRERSKQEEQSSGGNFWLTQGVRLGRRFGKAVIAAAQEGRLSYADAYDLTGLHGETFDRYAHFLLEGGRE